MLPGMDLPFLWLDPNLVDVSETTFRIRSRHSPALVASVRQAGIRTPILVEPTVVDLATTRYRIVSGWGRWLARPQPGLVPCFVLPQGKGVEAVWDVFVRDNEHWNIVETARVLAALAALPGLSAERIIAEKMPLLGLHASGDLYRRHLRLLDLPAVAQAFVEEEDLPLRRAAALGKLPTPAIIAFLELARALGLTHSEVGESIEQIEEIAAREGLEAAALIAALRRSESTKDSFRQALRQRRYPDLHRRQLELEGLASEVHFSVPTRIDWDPRLERPGIRLTVELADEDAVAALESSIASQRQTLQRLLREV